MFAQQILKTPCMSLIAVGHNRITGDQRLNASGGARDEIIRRCIAIIAKIGDGAGQMATRAESQYADSISIDAPRRRLRAHQAHRSLCVQQRGRMQPGKDAIVTNGGVQTQSVEPQRDRISFVRRATAVAAAGADDDEGPEASIFGRQNERLEAGDLPRSRLVAWIGSADAGRRARPETDGVIGYFHSSPEACVRTP